MVFCCTSLRYAMLYCMLFVVFLSHTHTRARADNIHLSHIASFGCGCSLISLRSTLLVDEEHRPPSKRPQWTEQGARADTASMAHCQSSQGHRWPRSSEGKHPSIHSTLWKQTTTVSWVEHGMRAGWTTLKQSWPQLHGTTSFRNRRETTGSTTIEDHCKPLCSRQCLLKLRPEGTRRVL